MAQGHTIHITDLITDLYRRRLDPQDHRDRLDRQDHHLDQYLVRYRRGRRLEYGDPNAELWTEIRKII